VIKNVNATKRCSHELCEALHKRVKRVKDRLRRKFKIQER